MPQRRWTWLSQILQDAGHEVTVIAPPPHYQRRISLQEWLEKRRARKKLINSAFKFGPAGEKIIRSGYIPAGSSLTQRVLNQATVALGAVWALLRKPGALRGYKPDLIIGTVPALPTAAVTFVASKLLGAPYIIDLRDAWPDLLEQSDQWNYSLGSRSCRERILSKGPLQLIKKLTRMVVNRTLKRASALMVTSSYLAEDLRNRKILMTNGEVPPVHTVRNVFPPETEYRKTVRVHEFNGRLNVLYAGTLGRAQNLANALVAAVIARRQGVEVHMRFVGAGVSKKALQVSVAEIGIDVSFEPRQEASDLAQFYDWADTALVHLTDWKPLNCAVPSKTYELMSAGIHISGVVSGETAELIRTRSAGFAVPPESPEALAREWVKLANEREKLEVSTDAGKWVKREREEVAPKRLLDLISKMAE